jgi:TRAP transporter TAXI family solute receptor
LFALCVVFTAPLAIPQQAIAQEKTYIRIGTGGVGGVWYPVGGGIAEVLQRELPNCVATAQSTGASNENARLLKKEKIEIGFNDSYVSWHAFHGKGPYEGETIANIRIIGRLYGAPMHIFTLKRYGVNTVADLKGKKVAVGASGSGTELYSRVVFPALGLKLKEDFDPVKIGYRPTVDAIKAGRVHGAYQIGGIPMPYINELAMTEDVIILEMSKKKAEEIDKKFPTFFKTTIPAKSYKGQDHDIATLEVRNCLLVRSDMSDDLVYKITKAIYSEKGLNYLKTVHKAMKGLTVENNAEWAKNPWIPLHPGAEKYYKELWAK